MSPFALYLSVLFFGRMCLLLVMSNRSRFLVSSSVIIDDSLYIECTEALELPEVTLNLSNMFIYVIL